jgi:SHS2 domain-containing protein
MDQQLKATDDGTTLMNEELGFAFQDHLGDVALCGFADTLSAAFANTGFALYAYMCPKLLTEISPTETRYVETEARNLHLLLFHFADELLYLFGSEGFFGRTIRIVVLETGGLSPTAAADAAMQDKAPLEPKERETLGEKSALSEEEEEPMTEKIALLAETNSSSSTGCRYYIKAAVQGEVWRDGHHSQGTEVKAITMHDLRVWLEDEDGMWHTKLVVDL